jgi:hypothetical protein
MVTLLEATMRRIAIIVGLILLAAKTLPAQAKGGITQCDKSFGTLAVVEPQNEIVQALLKYKLSSPTSLLRMFAQQSKCFTVVERGAAMQNIMQERALAQQGQLQQGSNMGGGQMKTADFVLTPAVLFSEGNAGGVGGVAAGLFKRASPVAGVIAGGLKFKEAQTSILIADTRSGVQVASAEGKAKKTDFSLGALGIGGGALAGGGGYTNTNEGKVVAASFLDNFNKVIESMKNDPELAKAGASGTETVKAGVSFQDGDVLVPKIANVKLLGSPAEGAKVLATLAKTDELVFLGEEKTSYVKVQGSSSEGWVKKTLVVKK